MPRDLPSKMDARSLQFNDTDVMSIIIWCIFVQLCTNVWCKVELDTLSQDLCFICTSASFDTKDVIPHKDTLSWDIKNKKRSESVSTAVDPKIGSKVAKKREFLTSWYLLYVHGNTTGTRRHFRNSNLKVLKFQWRRVVVVLVFKPLHHLYSRVFPRNFSCQFRS